MPIRPRQAPLTIALLPALPASDEGGDRGLTTAEAAERWVRETIP